MLAAFPDRVLDVESGSETRLSDVTCLAGGERPLVGTTDGLYELGGDPVRRFEGHVTAVARTADGDWWLGTEPSAVYRSDDGRSWEALPDLTTLPSSDEWAFPPRPDTHHVRWLAPDPTRAGRWYVAVEAGALVRTDDGGATWRDRVSGARRDTHELAVHPETGRLYCAAGDGYAESTDGGDSWHYPQDGLDERYCWSVAVGTDPDLRVLSSARSAGHAHRRGSSSVYRNAGDGWERIDALPHGEGCYRAVVRAAGDRFVVLSNRGLYESADGGDSWTEVVPGDDLPDAPPAGLVLD
ncbi:WD40/YVTN/BNR-like repeat-containing protein [Halosegnis marinus]|uniref:Sialidase family protein n=1 Tax=Halosegnis marinus TaxID=3034023 RepID=A0ABD5ZMM1_9EURY|nr:sialidase family protein [Halosegnis sp. DT85]